MLQQAACDPVGDRGVIGRRPPRQQPDQGAKLRPEDEAAVLLAEEERTGRKPIDREQAAGPLAIPEGDGEAAPQALERPVPPAGVRCRDHPLERLLRAEPELSGKVARILEAALDRRHDAGKGIVARPSGELEAVQPGGGRAEGSRQRAVHLVIVPRRRTGGAGTYPALRRGERDVAPLGPGREVGVEQIPRAARGRQLDQIAVVDDPRLLVSGLRDFLVHFDPLGLGVDDALKLGAVPTAVKAEKSTSQRSHRRTRGA
jgi:hypothetical protein